MKTFNDTEKQFLANYRPADKHFTYASEIEQVADALGLYAMSADDLQETRNAVVNYYSELQEAEVANYWDLRNAMMSVTAVVDGVALYGAFKHGVTNAQNDMCK